MIDRRELDGIFERQRMGVELRHSRRLSRDRRGPTRPIADPSREHTLKVVPEREPEYEPSDSRVRVLGLDLGQVNDPAACVMISRRRFDLSHPNRSKPVEGPKPPAEMPVEVEFIHEWPRGTDYTKIVHFILNLHETKTIDGRDVQERVWIDALVFDMTGVGRPFRDILNKEAKRLQFAGRIVGVNLSSSDTALKVQADSRGKFLTVAKLEMLTAVNIYAQQGLLRYPRGWDTKKLFEQMQTFQLKKTKAANVTFEQGGPGHHGDVVIALGLACHYMQRGFRQLSVNELPKMDMWGQPIT